MLIRRQQGSLLRPGNILQHRGGSLLLSSTLTPPMLTAKAMRLGGYFDTRSTDGLTTSQKPQPRGTSPPGLQVARKHASFGSQPLFDGIFLVPLKRGIHPLRWGFLSSAQPRSPMRFSNFLVFDVMRGPPSAAKLRDTLPYSTESRKGAVQASRLKEQGPFAALPLAFSDTKLPLLSAPVRAEPRGS